MAAASWTGAAIPRVRQGTGNRGSGRVTSQVRSVLAPLLLEGPLDYYTFFNDIDA